jgi:hypothetical protein
LIGQRDRKRRGNRGNRRLRAIPVEILPHTHYNRSVTDRASPNPPPSAGPPNPWTKNMIWLVVIGVVALNSALIFRSCRNLPGETLDKAGKVVEKTGKALADVASAFRQGTIRTEFLSYATTVTNQHYLQFATLKQNEIFTRSESATTGFGYIPLPDVVVEARAPVETTYYLDLNAKWDFVLKGNVVHVLAPPIRFNKPSVDASAITYEVKKGYLKTAEATENLKKSISSLAMLKAKENASLVRENGRRQTAEFVERWLLKGFTDGKQYSVKVLFADEKPPEDIRPGDMPLR